MNVPRLVTSHVPEELAYACIFWMDHIIDADGLMLLALIDALRDSLLTRLLQWMEVMALKGLLHQATEILLVLRDWLQTQLFGEANLLALASDGVRFIQQFSVVIAQNPLHIYASALPFTPTESAIRKTYLPLFPGLPRVITGLDSHWPPVVSTFSGRRYSYSSSVGSIAFSTDGSRIVIGSDDAMWLWYHKSGMRVKLEQHGVTSVAFSPDESMIASSSFDGEACIWDVTAKTTHLLYRLKTQQPYSTEDITASPWMYIPPPLVSVAFSPDSRLVTHESDLLPCLSFR